MKNKDYDSLSFKYRKIGGGNLSKDEVQAYLTARMPATFAVIKHVFEEISSRIPVEIKSYLDLGAGPGTGYLAAREVFPSLEKATLIEQNPHMRRSGKDIDATWIEGDMQAVEFPASDLVLFSYSLGEIPEKEREALIEKAFAVGQVVVVIEPGTPRGFKTILDARQKLFSLEGKIIAPCPHESACPMTGDNWCHFSKRLERSKEHRAIKSGDLGWEDEKYSYIAIAKEEGKPAQNRILRHPQKKSGHVVLQLCTLDGLKEKTVSKKQGPIYKKARKWKWGGEATF